MPAKKNKSTKKSTTQAKPKTKVSHQQSDEQVQAEITRALLGIVAISIFIIFFLAK